MQQVTVTQVTFGRVLGIGSRQGLVSVRSMSKDTILGRGRGKKKKNSAYVDVNYAVHSFGLRAGEQAWPTSFGSIVIAIDVFN